MTDAELLRELSHHLNHARIVAQNIAERWAASTPSRANTARVSRIAAGGLLLNDALDILSPLLVEGENSQGEERG